MTTTVNLCLFTIFLAYLKSSAVQGLSCAQCNALDPACRSGNIRPTTCPRGERYCYVINVYIDHSQGTYRGCSDRERTTECIPINIRDRSGTSCVHVCDWEGCNSSHGNVLSIVQRRRRLATA